MQFRSITYSYMLFETARNYLSLNASGNLSLLYRFCLSCLWPVKNSFDNYVVFRDRKKIIAQCKWQIGQLTNVLNYLHDNIQNRIYIEQERLTFLFAPTINYESTTFAPTINYESTTFAPSITDARTVNSIVQIYAPSDITGDTVKLADLTSTIEQIKITGINYEIITIP